MQGDALNATDPGPALQVAYSLLDKLVNGKDGNMLVLEFAYHGWVSEALYLIHSICTPTPFESRDDN